MFDRDIVLFDSTAALLQKLLDAAKRLPDHSTLHRRAEELSDTLLHLKDHRYKLAVCGHLKRGKSTLVNALLGRSDDLLSPVGRTVCTGCVLEYMDSGNGSETIQIEGEEPQPLDYARIRAFADQKGNASKLTIRAKFPLLGRAITFIDTPGRGSVYSIHDDLANRIVGEADAVLLPFSADLPLEDGEYEFLRQLSSAGKRKLFYVITKWDELETEREQNDVKTFIRAQIHRAGLPEGPLYPCSAKLLLGSYPPAERQRLWKASGLERLSSDLETFLRSESATGEYLRSRGELLLNQAITLADDLNAAWEVEERNQQLLRQAAEQKNRETALEIEQIKENALRITRNFESSWKREVDRFDRKLSRRTGPIAEQFQLDIRRAGLADKFQTVMAMQLILAKRLQNECDDLFNILCSNLQTLSTPLQSDHLNEEFDLSLPEPDISPRENVMIRLQCGLLFLLTICALGLAIWQCIRQGNAVLVAYRRYLACSETVVRLTAENSTGAIGAVGVAKGFLLGSDQSNALTMAQTRLEAAQNALFNAGLTGLFLLLGIGIGLFLIVRLVDFLLKFIASGRTVNLLDKLADSLKATIHSDLQTSREALLEEFRFRTDTEFQKKQTENTIVPVSPQTTDFPAISPIIKELQSIRETLWSNLCRK